MLAGDLNESHIGQRFKFIGMPVVEGELSGILSDEFDVNYRVKIVNSVNDGDLWVNGYFIDPENEVIPIGPVDPVREKLAEYIRVEYLKRTAEPILSGRAIVMADIFMELMEGGTDAKGEG